MDKFDKAFDLVIAAEGGYANDPKDAGNWTGGRCGVGTLLGTKYGIAANTYGNALIKQGRTIKGLTLEDAKSIYRRDYWKSCKCDQLPEPLCYWVFDCAVNCGVGRAIKLLQECLGVGQDGIIGNLTLGAVKKKYGIKVGVEYLTARTLYYTKCPAWNLYGKGWINRLFELQKKTN